MRIHGGAAPYWLAVGLFAASIVSGFAESHTSILRSKAMSRRLNRDPELCLAQD
jgi:hypothetical protein